MNRGVVATTLQPFGLHSLGLGDDSLSCNTTALFADASSMDVERCQYKLSGRSLLQSC